MPLDGILVNALVYELNNDLTGATIQKIYQPEKDELFLLLHTKQGPQRLIISANAANPRAHLTKTVKENPASPPMFCMLLRKKISGGKILSVTQPGLERVIDIAIESYTELGDLTVKHLIAELMGRHSNIILADEEGKIVDSIKHVDISVSSIRYVLPGLTYLPPPSQGKLNPLSASLDEIENALYSLNEGADVSSGLVGIFTGFSPLAAREISNGIAAETSVSQIIDKLEEMVKRIKKCDFEPCIIFEEEKIVDYWAFNVNQYKGLRTITQKDSISEAMDEFYLLRDLGERKKQRAQALNKSVTNALERCRKKLLLQQQTLKDALKKDNYKIKGDLIIANIYRIESGMDKVSLENYYEEGSPLIDIELDKRLSPSKNAQRFYSRYNKAKVAEKMVSEQMELNLLEIKYLESVLHSIAEANMSGDLEEIRQELINEGYIRKVSKKKEKEKKHAFAPLEFELDGFKIFVGKNNRQNDYLTLKIAYSNDIWLHTKDIPGSHVIIKSGGSQVPDDVLLYAARLAAKHSKAGAGAKTAVDYTSVKNVKKPSGAKPGMVIYENYKTLYVVGEN